MEGRSAYVRFRSIGYVQKEKDDREVTCTMQDRDIHLKKCQAKLDEWREFVDDLKARASGLSGEERQKMEDTIAAMERTISEGESCVSDTRTVSVNAWEAAKDDASDAWDMIEEGFEKNREAYLYNSD